MLVQLVKNNLRTLVMEAHHLRKEHGVLGIYSFAHRRELATRVSLCNHLIETYGLKRYLEIGVRNPESMNDKILAPHRSSVDPNPEAKPEFVLTSDDYFATHDHKYDIIFIDGLHTGDQVQRDIEHSLAALNPGGMILLHDMNPPTAFHAREDYEVNGEFPQWNGTSWEGYAWFRKNRPDLEMYVVDVDWGVGFIRPGQQKVWDGPIDGYKALEANRKELLNLISVKEFIRRHPKQAT